MSYSKSEYMLKYQKAKAKLLEYDVPKEDYPNFQLNYRDLAFPTILTISDYAEAIIAENFEDQEAMVGGLFFCSEYYDAAVKSREQIEHDNDFLLTGIIAYFFLSEYGNAMVLLSLMKKELLPNDMRKVLYDTLLVIFHGYENVDTDDVLVNELVRVIRGNDSHTLMNIVKNNYESAYYDGEINFFFAESLYAILTIAIKKLACYLLPQYSQLPSEVWREYLEQPKSVRIIWPAQELIGQKGFLLGKSGIIQLPTGVGKTKSIELIVRAMYLSKRGQNALIIAPLRALCNEITDDMRRAFGDEISINQFSDVLELDFNFLFLEKEENRVLICTPEKLKYILHHQEGFEDNIDLFIFDEGHMFDDEERGALYELLVTEIKRKKNVTQQMIILSAVLSNGEKILNWMDPVGILAESEKIKSTKKVVGFTSKEKEVHYFSDSFSEEDFYIPKAIRGKELKTKRNCIRKYFPEKDSQDIALYYSEQLCVNGGIAIYFGQKRSIPKFMKRLVEVNAKGIDFSRIQSQTSMIEAYKIKKLIEEYYGEEHEYAKASLLGVYPHYSSLPNGLRLSIEYAFRKNLVKVVACTSTLAQGVNIPIKYLIMTSFNSARDMMTTRNFQNLIGRTARSGVYTEGSILVTETTTYDNRESGRGWYRWRDVTSLFDTRNSEKCGSAILAIVQDFSVDYDTEFKFLGTYICNFICNHISDDWISLLEILFYEELKKNEKDNVLNRQVIVNRLRKYKEIIGIIENDIYYLLERNRGENSDLSIDEIAKRLCEETLAYFLATDTEKKMLNNLFYVLAEKIRTLALDVHVVAKSMIAPDLAIKVMEFIHNAELNEKTYASEEVLQCLVEFYCSVSKTKYLSLDLCLAWINNKSYYEMSIEYELKINDIEKICSNEISYNFCFLIGNVTDYLQEGSANLVVLTKLQKQLKYGVKSDTEISICEKIFNDRVIANKLLDVLGSKEIESDSIYGAVKLKKQEILHVLEDYPMYFENKIRIIK